MNIVLLNFFRLRENVVVVVVVVVVAAAVVVVVAAAAAAPFLAKEGLLFVGGCGT